MLKLKVELINFLFKLGLIFTYTRSESMKAIFSLKQNNVPNLLLLLSFAYPLLGARLYPNASFYEEYNKESTTSYYKFDLRDNISEFNRIQDSLNDIKEHDCYNLLHHYADIEFDNMEEVRIENMLVSLASRFEIRILRFRNCTFRKLPNSLNRLMKLEAIHFIECDSLKSLGKFDPITPIFEFYFFNCKIPNLPDGIEKLHPMVRLLIHLPDTLNRLNLDTELSKFTRRNNLIDLAIRGKDIAEFPESIFTLSSLRTLIFESTKTIRFPYKFDKLFNLLKLTLTCWDEEVENNARNNSNFIIYTPIDYMDNKFPHLINKRYHNMSFIFINNSPNSYLDETTVIYRPANIKDSIVKQTLSFAKHEFCITTNFNEEKLYVTILDTIPNEKIFMASLIGLNWQDMIRGVRTNNTIVIDLKNSQKYYTFLKITIGRYSKVFDFSRH